MYYITDFYFSQLYLLKYFDIYSKKTQLRSIGAVLHMDYLFCKLFERLCQFGIVIGICYIFIVL